LMRDLVVKPEDAVTVAVMIKPEDTFVIAVAVKTKVAAATF